MKRILSYKRAIGSVLGQGLAQSHRASPVATLKIQKLYGTPVLLSGLASLVLSSGELNILQQQFKNSDQYSKFQCR